MKKLFAIILLILVSIELNYAQDLIVKTNAEEIAAKIINIAEDFIIYNNWNEADGATYAVSKDKVLFIKYGNGEKIVFTTIDNNTSSKILIDETQPEISIDESQPEVSINETSPDTLSQPTIEYIVNKWVDIYTTNGETIKEIQMISYNEDSVKLSGSYCLNTFGALIHAIPFNMIERIEDAVTHKPIFYYQDGRLYNDIVPTNKVVVETKENIKKPKDLDDDNQTFHWEKKGLENQIRLNIGEGLSVQKNLHMSFDYIIGYRFSESVRVGAGVGLNYEKLKYEESTIYNGHYFKEYYEGAFTLPIFANVKVDFLKTKVSPYLALDLGYNCFFPASKFAKANKLGVFVRPTVGVDVHFSKCTLFFDLGCTYQHRECSTSLGKYGSYVLFAQSFGLQF